MRRLPTAGNKHKARESVVYAPAQGFRPRSAQGLALVAPIGFEPVPPALGVGYSGRYCMLQQRVR